MKYLVEQLRVLCLWLESSLILQREISIKKDLTKIISRNLNDTVKFKVDISLSIRANAERIISRNIPCKILKV